MFDGLHVREDLILIGETAPLAPHASGSGDVPSGRTARVGRKDVSGSLVGEAASGCQVVRSAIRGVKQTTSAAKPKILGCEINWQKIREITATINENQDTIEEILQEDKASKELLAERDMERVQNILNHKDEIHSRPKHTRLEYESAKKATKAKRTSHQENREDVGQQNWAYRKSPRVTLSSFSLLEEMKTLTLDVSMHSVSSEIYEP